MDCVSGTQLVLIMIILHVLIMIILHVLLVMLKYSVSRLSAKKQQPILMIVRINARDVIRQYSHKYIITKDAQIAHVCRTHR